MKYINTRNKLDGLNKIQKKIINMIYGKEIKKKNIEKKKNEFPFPGRSFTYESEWEYPTLFQEKLSALEFAIAHQYDMYGREIAGYKSYAEKADGGHASVTDHNYIADHILAVNWPHKVFNTGHENPDISVYFVNKEFSLTIKDLPEDLLDFVESTIICDSEPDLSPTKHAWNPAFNPGIPQVLRNGGAVSPLYIVSQTTEQEILRELDLTIKHGFSSFFNSLEGGSYSGFKLKMIVSLINPQVFNS